MLSVFIVNVTNKSIMLSVVMLKVIMLGVAASSATQKCYAVSKSRH